MNLNRSVSAKQRAREQGMIKAAAAGLGVTVWLAIAWDDARILVAIPVLLALFVLLVYRGRSHDADDDEDEDWLAF